jgi:hypothetical protein
MGVHGAAQTWNMDMGSGCLSWTSDIWRGRHAVDSSIRPVGTDGRVAGLELGEKRKMWGNQKQEKRAPP